MHALVTHVMIKADRLDEATDLLNGRVVPQAKSAAGFVCGYWMRAADNFSGVSFEIFESAEAAEAALQARPPVPPPEAPVEVVSVALMEVGAAA